jgi:hypothetical protein
LPSKSWLLNFANRFFDYHQVEQEYATLKQVAKLGGFAYWGRMDTHITLLGHA